MGHVIMDGKLFTSDRLGEQTTSVKGQQIDAWYSGKAHAHGGNIQALSAPDGFPLWVSQVEPGPVHDMRAARTHVLGALYWAACHLELPTLAHARSATSSSRARAHPLRTRPTHVKSLRSLQ